MMVSFLMILILTSSAEEDARYIKRQINIDSPWRIDIAHCRTRCRRHRVSWDDWGANPDIDGLTANIYLTPRAIQMLHPGDPLRSDSYWTKLMPSGIFCKRDFITCSMPLGKYQASAWHGRGRFDITFGLVAAHFDLETCNDWILLKKVRRPEFEIDKVHAPNQLGILYIWVGIHYVDSQS